MWMCASVCVLLGEVGGGGGGGGFNHNKKKDVFSFGLIFGHQNV